MIYHILPFKDWRQAYQVGHYIAPSLTTEGFIHFSTASQVLQVANTFYRTVEDLVLLEVDESRLIAELRYEAPVHPSGAQPPTASDELFPHLYGTLNLDAIARVWPLWQDADGFVRPPGVE